MPKPKKPEPLFTCTSCGELFPLRTAWGYKKAELYCFTCFWAPEDDMDDRPGRMEDAVGDS